MKIAAKNPPRCLRLAPLLCALLVGRSLATLEQNAPVPTKTIQFDSHYATLQLALNAACNGTIPGEVLLPDGRTTITQPTTVPSHCTLKGGRGSVTQSSSSLASPPLSTSGTNVRFANFQVDGNRSANPAVEDCLDVFNAKDVVIKSMIISNCNNNGLLIGGTSNNITVTNSEFYQTGPRNPAEQGTAGIHIGAGPVSHVSIAGNSRFHDNNTGITITNSGAVGRDVSGISINGNQIYSNGNDGILITTSQPAGGNILGVQVENNEIYCNGWPANGVGFHAGCKPGLQQEGSSASQGGVGVDIIQQGAAQVLRPAIQGNRIHDNDFEGVATTTNLNPIVNTAGSTVIWVLGPAFNSSLVSGQAILINGLPFVIDAVSSPKSLKVRSSAGNQAHVQTAFPEFMGATISNNISRNNGNTPRMVGPCFYNQLSDGVVYSGNTATQCALEGFENFYSSFLTYAGDHAYGNDTGATPGRNAGFASLYAFNVTYKNIETKDVATNPTQTIGVHLYHSTDVSVSSPSLLAVTPISNVGSTNVTSHIASRGSVN